VLGLGERVGHLSIHAARESLLEKQLHAQGLAASAAGEREQQNLRALEVSAMIREGQRRVLAADGIRVIPLAIHLRRHPEVGPRLIT